MFDRPTELILRTTWQTSTARANHSTVETYRDFLTKLAQASGIETPTRADVARLDRKRKKKGSNDEWRHSHDPDARITRMKDGRTYPVDAHF